MEGFTGMLTAIFITLKLIGVISWSWWWVLSPVWIPIAIILAVVTITIILEAIDRA